MARTKKTASQLHARRADSNAKTIAAFHTPLYATVTTNARMAAMKTNTYANGTDCARTINSLAKTVIASALSYAVTVSTIAMITATKRTAKLRRANGTRALRFASNLEKTW